MGLPADTAISLYRQIYDQLVRPARAGGWGIGRNAAGPLWTAEQTFRNINAGFSDFSWGGPTFTSGLGPTRLNIHNELADLITLRTFFGSDFPNDLKGSQSQLRSVARVVVAFLVAADEFIVAVMDEKNWADVQLL